MLLALKGSSDETITHVRMSTTSFAGFISTAETTSLEVTLFARWASVGPTAKPCPWHRRFPRPGPV